MQRLKQAATVQSSRPDSKVLDILHLPLKCVPSKKGSKKGRLLMHLRTGPLLPALRISCHGSDDLFWPQFNSSLTEGLSKCLKPSRRSPAAQQESFAQLKSK